MLACDFCLKQLNPNAKPPKIRICKECIGDDFVIVEADICENCRKEYIKEIRYAEVNFCQKRIVEPKLKGDEICQ